jgi:hypothetical protein
MAALNIKQLLIDALWSTIEARTALTTAIGPSGFVKTSQTGYVDRARGIDNHGKYPLLFIFSSGGNTPEIKPTFGYGSPIETLDYGVPCTETFSVKLVFDFVTDDLLMPIEAEVSAALNSLDITCRTLGYRWAGVVTPGRANRENVKFAGKPRTVVTWSPSIKCCPKKSQLIAQ